MVSRMLRILHEEWTEGASRLIVDTQTMPQNQPVDNWGENRYFEPNLCSKNYCIFKSTSAYLGLDFTRQVVSTFSNQMGKIEKTKPNKNKNASNSKSRVSRNPCFSFLYRSVCIVPNCDFCRKMGRIGYRHNCISRQSYEHSCKRSADTCISRC